MKRVNKILENGLFLTYLKEIELLEKKRIFCGHGIEHLLSVARIMWIIALENHINIDKEEIYAAALLHDIGRAQAYKNGGDHSLLSGEAAEKILYECGFDKCERILSAVIGHNDMENKEPLCVLLKKADKLSRSCFLCSAYKECNWNEERKNKGIEL